MTTGPVATGARLLGIHPKTWRHWLLTAHLPLGPHPPEARSRGVAQAALLEMASLHSRPLPDLSSVPALEKDTASSCAQACATPLPAHQAEHASCAAALAAPAAALADLLQHLSQLHTQVAPLQHHLVRFTLGLLHERTGNAEQRLRPLEALTWQPLESLQAAQQTDLADAPAPSPRLLPAEVRARSRVTALIEDGAHGQ